MASSEYEHVCKQTHISSCCVTQLMVIPERGVGRFIQGLVSQQGGTGCGCFILEVGGNVLGRGPTKDLQPFLQHLLPALQRLQHSVTKRRAHRQICS